MRAVTVGIISIGDMGLGMAKLLQAHDYRVVTVSEGRSEHTLARIHAANIDVLASDNDLVAQADYVLSIVPPRNALATAQRIATACTHPDTVQQRDAIEDVNGQPRRSPLYFLELNATPPRLAEEMAALFAFDDESATSTPFVRCHFLDGGIIGGPPTLVSPSPDSDTADANKPHGTWKRPSVVLSGPVDEPLPLPFAALASALNAKLISPRIGAASTLKLTFAALTKGLTALSILSFSTAQREALLPELLAHLDKYSPATAALARRGVIGMAPKAYLWEEEMRGIGEALDTQGGWDGVGGSVYGGFAEVYRSVAEDTVLGLERVGARERGMSVEDAAVLIADRRREGEEAEAVIVGFPI